MNSQNIQVLTLLKQGRKLTALDALREIGCMRLAARIYDLRGVGHEISGVRQQVGKKFVAVYALIKEPKS